MQISCRPITLQQLSPFGHVEMCLLKLKLRISDLSNLNVTWLLVADNSYLCHTVTSRVYRGWSEKQSIYPVCFSSPGDNALRREWAECFKVIKKATINELTNCCNQGMWKSTSILKQMAYSSSSLPLLFAKNMRLSLQFTRTGQLKINPGRMSLDSCCDIEILGSECDVNNIKALTHPSLYQRFVLVVL